MKVLAITPNWRESRGILPTDTTRPPVAPPIEWQYFLQSSDKPADGAARDGFEISVFDEYSRNRKLGAFPSALETAQPDIVLLSTAPSYLYWRCPPTTLDAPRKYVSHIRRVKPRIPIILIGPHGTADPASTLRATGATHCFRGEIDLYLPAAVRHVAAGEDHPYVATAAEQRSVAPQSPLSDEGLEYTPRWISSEPHAWLPDARKSLMSLGSRFAVIETSRGCSFDCGYCFRAGFRRQLRTKPLAAVEAELDYLRALDVAYVFLIDETFGLPRPHARAVMEMLARRDIRFGIQTRPDIWTARDMELLASSGCIYAEVGTESTVVSGVAALEKFRKPDGALEATETIKRVIPHVGVNIVDVGNPDLQRVPRRVARGHRDNEGRRPPAFIPYPSTPWGDTALASAGGRADWQTVDALHATYDLASRDGVLGASLRRSRTLRRATMAVLRHVSRLEQLSVNWRTRNERRQADEHG
jgi:anaerobic magnesium-protoporphyrin IX monomethyl ester cyclase